MPPFVLLFIWGAWLVQVLLAIVIVRRFAMRAGHQPGPSKHPLDVMASVIVPFKGVDADMRTALERLYTQDYPTYRLVFVVESEADPAHAMLQELAEAHPDRQTQILMAGLSPENQSQKIHNQLCAIDWLDSRCEGDEYWVFADSDAAPGDNWLYGMVRSLRNPKRDALHSGYRWLLPVVEGDDADRRKPSIWSQLASVINGSVAGFCGRDRWNVAWGGSMSLRVDRAREADIRSWLRGALTDDYQLTRMMQSIGKPVEFVPAALSLSPVDFTRSSFFNFGHRQYLITRVYAPKLYWGTLAMVTGYLVGQWSAIGYLAYVMATGPTAPRLAWPAGVLVVAWVMQLIRSRYRRRAVRDKFGDDVVAQWRKAYLIDAWLTPVWMLIHWLILLRAAVGRTMNWRGNIYRLNGPQQIEKLSG